MPNPLSPAQQDAIIKATLSPDDSCAHNFAPPFALIAEWLAAEREAGAAEVRARVEAVLEPAIRMDDKGYRNAASDALPAIRDALNGGADA